MCTRISLKQIRQLAAAILAMLLTVLPPHFGATATQAPEVRDYVILIDTSGSMIGNPAGSGNAVIFPRVKTAIDTFISSLGAGANVSLLPFSDDVNPAAIRSFTINSNDDRAAAVSYVDGLQADGALTWLYRSIETGLTQLQAMRNGDDHLHVSTLMVYTDGIGNGPGDSDVDSLIDALNLARADASDLLVKYFSLGLDVPDEATLEANGVDVITNPRGELPVQREIRVSPGSIELGAMVPGQSLQQTLELALPDGDLSKLRLVLGVEGSLPNGAVLSIDQSRIELDRDTAPVTFTLSDDALPADDYTLTLSMRSNSANVWIAPDSLPIHFIIREPSPTATDTPSPVPTSTPSPKATFPPVPTATFTPVPTSTPVPGAAIDTNSIDLGSSKMNVSGETSSPATARMSIPVEFNGNGAAFDVSIVSTSDDAPFELLLPGGSFATSLRVVAGDLNSLTLVASVDRNLIGGDQPESRDFTAALRIQPVNGTVEVNGATVNGVAEIPISYTVRPYTPFDKRRLIPPIAAILALLLLYSLLPRLPNGLSLQSNSHDLYLRGMQRLGGRIGGSVVLGTDRDGLSLVAPIARVGGRWRWRKRAMLRALRDGIEADDQPLLPGQRIELRSHTTLRFDGNYLEVSGGSPAELDASDPDWGYTASQPRLRLWSRAHPASTEEFDW